MKTTKIVVLTAGAVIGLVLLICFAMWSYMSKQTTVGQGHHPTEQSSLVRS